MCDSLVLYAVTPRTSMGVSAPHMICQALDESRLPSHKVSGALRVVGILLSSSKFCPPAVILPNGFCLQSFWRDPFSSFVSS